MSPLTSGRSPWLATVPETSFPELADDATCDVCVVGGGITGLLAAWELQEAGLDVVVLERGRVAASVTGHTTSKLTSQHGVKYRALEQSRDAEAARSYGAANERGLARIVELAAELGGDAAACVERRDAWVYGSVPGGEQELRTEAEAAARAGLPARYEGEAPLPFPTYGAVVFADQAQFDPRRLLVPLAQEFVRRGGRVYEGTSATTLDPGTPSIVGTEGGAVVQAAHVVLATLLPSLFGRELMASLYCHQGFAVALPMGRDPLADGVYITSDRPMRSLRTFTLDDELFLQVGGSAWVEDPSSGRTPWDELDSWGREHFGERSGAAPADGAQAATWRWSTQDYSTSDGAPLIGRVRGGHDVYVAAGFGGWGLTTAAVAAELVRDQVLGGAPQAWHEVFTAARDMPELTTRTISAHRTGLPVDADAALAALEPGEAIVLPIDGEEVAACRTADGTLHRRSAACTHLGGIVLWDRDEACWNCPCHGSTFAPDGAVLSGPATEPLPER